MKLEVGKTYVAQNGGVHGPIRDDCPNDEGYNYHENSSYYQWNDWGQPLLGKDIGTKLIREYGESSSLSISIDTSDMRSEMERIKRACQAFIDVYDNG